MATNAAIPEGRDTVPSISEIFFGFMFLGLIGFGGVLPLARRMMVEQRKWLNDEEFIEVVGLCQFLPGGNIINVSVAVGLKFRGVAGAVAGLLGIIIIPTAIVMALGAVYEHYQSDPRVMHLFAGLAAAAAGLLVSMAVKLALPLRGKPMAIAIAAVCFIAIAVLRFPLLPTMLVLTPISIFILWRFPS
jgi:chromate transporter